MVHPHLIFVLGTLSAWIGWALVLRAIALAMSKAPIGKQGVNGGLAAALLAVGYLATQAPDAVNAGASLRLPVAWVAMAFTAWIALFSLAFVIVRVAQASQALNAEERKRLLGAAATWAVAGIISFALWKSEPKNQVVTFRGSIPLSPTLAGSILMLAAATVAAMVASARKTASRGFAKGVVHQVALLTGAFVFGLPFAFLLVTSFKEDRDMSSANGIVWVPKVQETVPYFSKTNPLFEATYNGQKVQGVILEKKPDGTTRIDITNPLAIRGVTFDTKESEIKEVPRQAPLVTVKLDGEAVKGMVIEDLDDGSKKVHVLEPASLKGKEAVYPPTEVEPIRNVGLRWQNYTEAISFLPPETNNGLVYLKNTLILVVLSVIGTILSSSIVAYAFSRMRFPGKNVLFSVLLATMMLPAAVTLLPQFLIFRGLGWIDTLLPLWVPAFFGSAFNIFLLRQFFMGIPMELEDASKMDGCTYLKTFWSIMLPQIKPALAVIAIWTLMGAWNNFMGPLIYVNSPENMPISYALQLFQGDRLGEPGLLMAFTTMALLPVLVLFFFAQRYFIEGVTLSGLGGR